MEERTNLMTEPGNAGEARVSEWTGRAAGPADGAVIRVENVHKTYDLGEQKVHALRGVSLEIRAGEFVAVMGAWGSGISTLIKMLGCLERPARC